MARKRVPDKGKQQSKQQVALFDESTSRLQLAEGDKFFFRSRLSAWYDEFARRLPWRDCHEGYRVWISEVILQQTQVAQGYDYYLRFIERFPNLEALAAASEHDVLQLWQGLGYYSRARNLHRAAQIAAGSGGFPKSYDHVRALPGVGAYTAAAICSFAYNQPYATVDGNVYRVLSRYFAAPHPIDTSRGQRFFAELAQSLLDCEQPARHNQALMDFGALQCKPHAPKCRQCPLASRCCALSEGRVEHFPVKARQVKVEEAFLIYVCLVADDGSVLLHRRPPRGIWAGLYEPPLLVYRGEEPDLKRIAFDAERLLAVAEVLQAPWELLVSNHVHRLTHRLFHATFYRLQVSAECPAPRGYEWVSREELSTYPLPRLVERFLSSLVNNTNPNVKK